MNDSEWSKDLSRRLFEQRVVLLTGPLDDATASRVSAELMTLDAEGDDAISLRIDCADGSLALALTCRAAGRPPARPVHGAGGGPAVGVLSVCDHRVATPSTRFALREPATRFETRGHDVAQWVRLRAEERQRFIDRVADAVRRPAAVVDDAFGRGVFMSAPEAAEFGLIDEISRPKGAIHQLPGPAIGFRPGR